LLVVWLQDADSGAFPQKLPRLEVQQKVSWGEVREDMGRYGRKLVVEGNGSRSEISSATEEDVQSEASEWELRERREREEERRVEAEELGAGGEEQPLFLPTPSFMASAE
jgi:hypothetical protein